MDKGTDDGNFEKMKTTGEDGNGFGSRRKTKT